MINDIRHFELSVAEASLEAAMPWQSPAKVGMPVDCLYLVNSGEVASPLSKDATNMDVISHLTYTTKINWQDIS